MHPAITDKPARCIDDKSMSELDVEMRAHLYILTHLTMYSSYCVQVTLPTSYNASTGIPVDASGLYFITAAIRGAWAHGSFNGIFFEVTEEGSNTFANKKFVLRPKFATAPHDHLIDIANGGLANYPITKPAGNGVALAGGIVNGAGGATGLTGIQENEAVGASDVPNGTDLQALCGMSQIWAGFMYE